VYSNYELAIKAIIKKSSVCLGLPGEVVSMFSNIDKIMLSTSR